MQSIFFFSFSYFAFSHLAVKLPNGQCISEAVTIFVFATVRVAVRVDVNNCMLSLTLASLVSISICVHLF